MLLNTESEISLIIIKPTSVWEVSFSELSVLNFKTSFKNLVSFIASDSNVNSDFLVSFNVETSYGKPGSGWYRFLSSKIL